MVLKAGRLCSECLSPPRSGMAPPLGINVTVYTPQICNALSTAIFPWAIHSAHSALNAPSFISMREIYIINLLRQKKQKKAARKGYKRSKSSRPKFQFRVGSKMQSTRRNLNLIHQLLLKEGRLRFYGKSEVHSLYFINF